jgi:predicted transposase YbfD/YdcC
MGVESVSPQKAVPVSSVSLIGQIRALLGCRDDEPLLAGPPSPALAACLAEVFASLRDRRGRRGIRHRLPPLLATLTLAVACGETGVEPAAAMAKRLDQDVLGALGARRNPATGLFEAPSAATLGRLHKAVDVVALQDALTRWVVRWALRGQALPAEVAEAEPDRPAPRPRKPRPTRADALRRTRPDGWTAAAPLHPFLGPAVLVDPGHRPARAGVAVDGKERRGARRGGRRKVHMVAAVLHHTGPVLAQERVARTGKANEVSHFASLLTPLPLEDAVVTGDAMQTTHGNARFLREAKNAHYLFPVLGNQPTLRALLGGLDWEDTPVAAATFETGHGRIETRTLRVLPVPDGVEMAGAAQAVLVERYTTYWRNGRPRTRAEAVLYITSLGPDATTPADLLAHVRGHWTVEHVHWLRDVTWDEDASLLRAGDGPELMSVLTNLVITLFRILGVTKFRDETRRNHENPHRALRLLLL